MKPQVGLSMFSVMTELMEDYMGTLENVAKAGYKYIEYIIPRSTDDKTEPLSQTFRMFVLFCRPCRFCTGPSSRTVDAFVDVSHLPATHRPFCSQSRSATALCIQKA